MASILALAIANALFLLFRLFIDDDDESRNGTDLD